MTDELYDYFGGNASKKVEPIEDDDVEVNEAANADASSEQQTDATSEVAASAGPADVASETKEPAKKAGHWDFLAGVLGVGGKKPSEASDSSAVSAKTPSEAQASDVGSAESLSLIHI